MPSHWKPNVGRSPLKPWTGAIGPGPSWRICTCSQGNAGSRITSPMLTALQAWIEDYEKEERYQMAVRTTNAGGGDFEKAPEGMHVARCYKIIDCGTHINPTFGKKQRLAWIMFELPKALMTKGEYAGKPFSIGKRYGLSHNEKATLRYDLESWYGKRFDTAKLDAAGGFDLEKLIGPPAMLNIVHSA